MKRYLTTVICAAGLCLASTAYAGGGFQEMVENTQKDFNIVKEHFRAAYSSGYSSWGEYEKATGFSLKSVEDRIVARRSKLSMMARSANTTMEPSTRGLAKMLIKDLDDINLSILALIRDDKGYAGYIKTPDETLVGVVSGWQEGVRLALREAKRTVRMVKMVATQAGAGAEHVPMFMH